MSGRRSSARAEPPRLSRALLRRLVPAHLAEEILDELDQRYCDRVHEHGQRAARHWYRRQLLHTLPRGRSTSRLRVGEWIGDFRHGLRKLVRRPIVSAALVITLALGIGANAAIFSVINGVLLQPLPYPDPDRLVALSIDLPSQGSIRRRLSAPELLDLRSDASRLESLGAIWYRPGALTDDASEPEEIAMAFVSAGLLDTVGLDPMLGRLPTDAEDIAGAERVIVLAHHLWQRRYGADRDIVGRRVEFDGVPHTVVGVMPAGFQVLLPPDARVPASLDAWVTFGGSYDQYPRTWRIFSIIARLGAGVTHAAAEAQLAELATRLRQDHPEYAASGLAIRLEPLGNDLVTHVRPMLLLLLGAVGLMLMIVCANCVNLLLATMADNRHELAVRSALGATRGRLIRQLVAENLVLVLTGTAIGIALARWGVAVLPMLAPEGVPRVQEVALDWTVLGYVALIATTISLLFGVVAASHVRKPQRNLALRSGARNADSSSRSAFRDVLVVLEVGICLMLLIGVGLLAQSFAGLIRNDPGYSPAGIMTVKLSLVDSSYPYSGPEKIAEFYRQLEQRLSESAGVEAVGGTTRLPLDGRAVSLGPISYESDAGVTEWGSRSADHRVVSPGFLPALGARLVAGRIFDWSDDLASPPVVMIDTRMARLLWPTETAIGKRLQVERFLRGAREPVWTEVIGVIEHLRQDPANEGIEQVFHPHSQVPMRTITMAIRGDQDADSLLRSVSAAVQGIDGNQPTQAPVAMSAYLSESVAATRFAMMLLGLFSAVALVLAVVGTYGVISYSVAQRTRELGIQMALGASPGRVQRTVLFHGATLAGVGIALGLLGAFGLSRFLGGLLFGVGATDPMTFAAVPALLAAVAMAACYLPARRAARLDPTCALRAD